MMKKIFLLAAALLAFTLAASAQDLKPVKDKASKKYGYQDKQKNWVIPPTYDDAKRFDDGFAIVKMSGREGLINTEGQWILQPLYDDIGKFDRNGLCELKIKEGGIKLHGIADWSGNLVLPVEHIAVDIPRNANCILASRYVDTPGLTGAPLWGVYTLRGEEIYSPQFLSQPSFSGGSFIAKGVSGLYGVADLKGRTLLPFDYLALTRNSGSFLTLDRTFNGHPGAILAYDPMGDPVRAAAWNKGCIGIPLYPNQVRIVSIQSGYSYRRAACREADIDWGRGRFLRLEPFEVENGGATAMAWPEGGKYYTLKAMLYEADGTPVGEVTDCGYLEAECAEGVVYSAGGLESWLILRDPNTLSLPSFTLNLTDYHTRLHDTVYNGLGIRAYDVNQMTNVREYANRNVDIIKGDNVGVTSYLPPVLDMEVARQMRDAMRPEIFHHAFRMGEVVNCKLRTQGEDQEVELSEQLVCHFGNRFQDPYFYFTGDEVIYWGPHNARTVRLSLEPSSSSAMADASGKHWTLVLSMYEEDGSWLRTLARAPYADFAQGGVLVFDGLGIALLSPYALKGPQRPDAPRIVKIHNAQPLPHLISALEAFQVRPPAPPKY